MALDLEGNTTTTLAELRAWYLYSLRPKLADAAGSGAVQPRTAAELDREVRDLLRLPRRHLRAVA
jgi:hypothetical protein